MPQSENPVDSSWSIPPVAEDFADWRVQMANLVDSPGALEARSGHAIQWSSHCDVAGRRFGMLVTPYYASLMKAPLEQDPIFKMCVPDARELTPASWLTADPLGEEPQSPVPGLVHRYRNRALILVTSRCAVHCRYCMRKRKTSEERPYELDLTRVCDYLREHPEVDDVILSGGDPLTLDDFVIETVLTAIRTVPSVRIVRIGTRVPVVLPMRITDALCSMLRRFHPLYINTHFNHPAELTSEARVACEKLADVGIPMGNQSVLLRGINDSVDVLAALCSGLLAMRVRPYYLHQCDLVEGVEHFRVSTAKGMDLVAALRCRLGGLAVPVFAVDLPGSDCKIPLQQPYVTAQTDCATVLRNKNGVDLRYPEPRELS